MNGRYIIYRDLYVGQSSSPVSKAISMCLSLAVPERDVYSCASIYVILSVWIYVIASYIRFCELSDEIEESFISTKQTVPSIFTPLIPQLATRGCLSLLMRERNIGRDQSLMVKDKVEDSSVWKLGEL